MERDTGVDLIVVCLFVFKEEDVVVLVVKICWLQSFPWYPALQWHKKDPCVFTHEPCMHGELKHSLMSSVQWVPL